MFRFTKLLNALANPADREAQREAGAELEAVRQGGQHGGVVIPPSAVASMEHQRVGVRVLSTADGSGGGVVETELRGEDFIESLLGENFALSRATVYSGLSGKVELPRESNVITGSWVGETTAPTESDPTYEQLSLAPKRLVVHTDVSRALLMMGNPDAEDLVKRLLSRSISRALDNAILYGTGASNQPRGIANISAGLTDISLTAANSVIGSKVWEACCNAEKNLADENINEDSIEALMSPAFYYQCRFKSYDDTDGDEDTTDSKVTILPTRESQLLEQYPVTKSGNATTGNGMFLGDFSQVVVGQWTDGFEVMTNPYSMDTQGIVRITVTTLADVQFKHKKAFQQVIVA